MTIDMCAMIHPCVLYESFVRVPRLIHMCAIYIVREL